MAWNGSNGGGGAASAKSPQSRKAGSPSRSPRGRGILAGLAVVLGGGLAAWLLLRPAADPGPQVAERKPPAPVAETKPRVEARPAAVVEEESPEVLARRKRAERLKAMSPRERIDFLFEEAKKRPINLEPASNRVYATGTEQVLDWIFTTTPGDMPPILPQLPQFEEAHLVEILAHRNEIRETDSDRAKIGKEMVMLAKEELAKYLSEGGTAKDFLSYYHDRLREAHAQYQETQKAVMQIAREEPELLPDYLDSVNRGLEEKGIKPVTIPRPLARHLGLQLDDRHLRGK